MNAGWWVVMLLLKYTLVLWVMLYCCYLEGCRRVGESVIAVRSAVPLVPLC